ncbi:MAG: glycosyltransferase [Bacteroidales bacterium]|nr:glycosyltransferase [Bacteroidales bacterium]
MNVLLVAENAILPVISYGGMPRMVWCLGKALARKGHQVTFLCAKAANVDFARVVIRDKSVSLVSQIPADIDIVHFHSPVPSDLSLPYVETIHGNYNKSLSRNSIFLSANHAERFGSSSFVYNGLDWDDEEYAAPDLTKRRRNYHFLGKAAWKVKNVAGAVDIAKRFPKGVKLDVLGGNRINFHMGFRMTMSPKIVFHGMCGGVRKRDVMQCSKGLLNPVIWHEPFGLNVIESLYFGAPVFCTPYGAMPEIVVPEVGFMSSSTDEMIYGIENASFSSIVCHDYVRTTFNADKMADGYIEKYEIVLNGGHLNASIPKSQCDNKKLLPWNKE